MIGHGRQPAADLHVDLLAQIDMQRAPRPARMDSANVGRLFSLARGPPAWCSCSSREAPARMDCTGFVMHHFTHQSAKGIAVKPFFERNGIVLYHGDCHEVMPTLKKASFDLLITDPPYCSGGATSAAKTSDPIAKYCHNNKSLGRPTFTGDAKDQRAFVAWCIFWLSQARQLVKDGGYGVVFTDWRQLPCTTDAFQGADFIWRGVMAWDKGGGSRSPHKGYARHQCEYLVWGTNGKCRPREDAGPFPGCYRETVKQNDKHHITGKPTPLMAKLVEFCPVGGRVLDCFAGSGTTLVACAETGREAVGVEREEANCEIAVKRLEAALKNRR